MPGSAAHMRELFEVAYSPAWGYDERHFLDSEHRYTRMHALLRRCYGELAGRRIVDVGWCRGLFLTRLRSYDDIALTGIEIDEDERAVAAARGIEAEEHYLNTFDDRTIVARLPYRDESVDVVVAGEVLEHVVDTEGFARETLRVLKPEGALVVTTPNLLWWKNRVLMLAGRYPDCLEHKRYRRMDFGHVRIFSADRLGGLLSEVGFDDIRIEGVRLGPLSTITSTPRRLALALDRLAMRAPTLCNDLVAFASKPRGVNR